MSSELRSLEERSRSVVWRYGTNAKFTLCRCCRLFSKRGQAPNCIFVSFTSVLQHDELHKLYTIHQDCIGAKNRPQQLQLKHPAEDKKTQFTSFSKPFVSWNHRHRLRLSFLLLSCYLKPRLSSLFWANQPFKVSTCPLTCKKKRAAGATDCIKASGKECAELAKKKKRNPKQTEHIK